MPDLPDRKKIRRQETREWFQALKATLKCVQCGENHPAALDFHHENPHDKEINLSGCLRNRYSKERIRFEMSKCIVLCANCHRKFHYEEKILNEQRFKYPS